ncbi:unnamed protein product [Moneuplotes crassus]|uniref:Uncharacterized protein n=1 Tax=Euplotes crassus TaxID=5936 RepID=A0AAD1XH24_EUPCR|nr:unnamed protein product [Moneuplotes crassus]
MDLKNQIPEELKQEFTKIGEQIDKLNEESEDFGIISKTLNGPLETSLEPTTNTMKQQEEVMAKLSQENTEKDGAVRDKTRLLFEQDLAIEDHTRELEKQDKDHKDSVQHKEELYSKYHNNQERALKDLKVQYEGIEQFIQEFTRLNKDTVNLEELAKQLGLDKTEELLEQKSKAPYDELKLRENKREIEELRHLITQASKDEDDIKTRLIHAKGKENDLQSKFEIYSNYKILNTEIRSDVDSRQEEIRRQEKEDQALRQQNEELERLLKEKQEESQGLEQSIKLIEQLVDAHSE